MKKITLTAACALAILAFSVPAPAHCGTCGVGDEDATQEECDAKCADEGDTTACVGACLEQHEKEHVEPDGSAQGD